MPSPTSLTLCLTCLTMRDMRHQRLFSMIYILRVVPRRYLCLSDLYFCLPVHLRVQSVLHIRSSVTSRMSMAIRVKRHRRVHPSGRRTGQRAQGRRHVPEAVCALASALASLSLSRLTSDRCMLSVDRRPPVEPGALRLLDVHDATHAIRLAWGVSRRRARARPAPTRPWRERRRRPWRGGCAAR